MLCSIQIQIQFPNKCSTNYISIIHTICNHTTYLITDVTSNMKNILFLLLQIIIFNLSIQCLPNHKRLTLNQILYIIITNIFKWETSFHHCYHIQIQSFYDHVIS